jgi:hypothetical protein
MRKNFAKSLAVTGTIHSKRGHPERKFSQAPNLGRAGPFFHPSKILGLQQPVIQVLVTQ